jgi:hypothetical protein
VSLVRSAGRILGQSRLIVLAMLVAAVFFTAGFVELAMARRQMEAHYQQALERVDRTRRQNTLLQLQLERAQRGELLLWQAWDMFGRLPAGTGIIQAPPGPVHIASLDQREAPIWEDWLNLLGIN